MILLLGAALTAGLVGTPHCLGMCGPFVMACGTKGSDTVMWHAGRLATYSLLGAVAGALGAVVPGPSWVAPTLSIVLLFWFAGALAGVVPSPVVVVPGLRQMAGSVAGKGGRWQRFAFGMVNGLLPCGLVYAALSIPVSAGSAAWGAATMFAFGLGTVPGLTALVMGFRRFVHAKPRLRRVIAGVILFAGLFAVAMRAGWI